MKLKPRKAKRLVRKRDFHVEIRNSFNRVGMINRLEFEQYPRKLVMQVLRAGRSLLLSPVRSTKSAFAISNLKKEIEKFWRSDCRRSVVFLHNSYYHFLYLAEALRRRGWAAMSVSMEAPSHPDQMFFHGEDINLYDPDPVVFRNKVEYFYMFVREKIAMVHVGQVGRLSFFPENTDGTYFRERIPWDFLELKKAGTKIGYTCSGCLDLNSRSSFYRWSGGMCNSCHWRDRTDICSDVRNLGWGHMVQQVCDLICIEADVMLDFRAHHNVYREPLTMALSPEIWRPGLEIPEDLRIQKTNGEVIVLHSFGNADQRMLSDDHNAKGSGAIFRAVRNLQAKGFQVRLVFHDKVPSQEFRFIQSQADIIVDQLLYGRYGATARESMMLGKPTVAHINPAEEFPGAESQCILETPVIDATKDTVEAVLEDLIKSPERRKTIGEVSRQHALKWWSADACAERYETVYDRIMRGERPMDRIISPFHILPQHPEI